MLETGRHVLVLFQQVRSERVAIISGHGRRLICERDEVERAKDRRRNGPLSADQSVESLPIMAEGGNSQRESRSVRMRFAEINPDGVHRTRATNRR